MQLRLEQQRKARQELTIGGEGDNSFGSQIRSYVLHPYKIVKDARTGWETGRADDFLSGDFPLLSDAMASVLLAQQTDASTEQDTDTK